MVKNDLLYGKKCVLQIEDNTIFHGVCRFICDNKALDPRVSKYPYALEVEVHRAGSTSTLMVMIDEDLAEDFVSRSWQKMTYYTLSVVDNEKVYVVEDGRIMISRK